MTSCANLAQICCSRESFSLSHHDPDLFDRSQWCPKERVSVLYLVYRIVLACIFVAGISTHIADTGLGLKWFIYMTDQGIFCLCILYILEAGLVVTRFAWEQANDGSPKKYHDISSINWLYKICWAMNACFFTIALWISVIYWSILHKFVMESNLLKTDLARGLNVFLHAINSISCLLDIFISAKPWKPMHFIWSICFGLYYTFFSLIYWAAGGVGLCREDPFSGEKKCDTFIYPILDWGNKPGLAIGIILAACIVLPLIHAFWFGLTRLRMKIYEWVYKPDGLPVSPNYSSAPTTNSQL